MAKILSTFDEVDIHIKNLQFMYDKNKYIPVYYHMALIKGLHQANEGLVLYFYTELGRANLELLGRYFGTQLDGVDEAPIKVNRPEDLKGML